MRCEAEHDDFSSRLIQRDNFNIKKIKKKHDIGPIFQHTPTNDSFQVLKKSLLQYMLAHSPKQAVLKCIL